MTNLDKQHTIRTAQAILAKCPLYLDTETTGLGRDGQAVQIAIVDTDGTIRLDTLIRPTIPISLAATHIHHIDEQILSMSNAPAFDQVLPVIQRILLNRTLVVYNFAYDWQVLHASAQAHHQTVDHITLLDHYCAMDLYAQFWGEYNEYYGSYRWQSLTAACKQQRLRLPKGLAAHSALADAEMTRRLMIAIAHTADAELEQTP